MSGPQWRCDGATDDELIGLLNRWAAVESWAAAGKLGVTRELLRRRAVPIPGTIPGIGAKLADGTIDYVKAAIIVKELFVLDDAQAAEAEALILDQLAGKTPGQIGKMAPAAVLTVDPDGARKRREHAEREDARIRMWRENTGASAMAAYGLPTDAALSANANIDQRAKEYKKANIAPGARMDQLRVLAFCDILNGITLTDRIALAEAEAGSGDRGAGSGDGPDGNGRPASDRHGDDEPKDDDWPGFDAPDDDDGPDGDDGPGGAGGTANTAAAPGTSPARPGEAGLPARPNLTLPLITLLGLADRPGEGHGLGPLDPALVRDLAATAVRSPRSSWCVTITDHDGHAIGHGCAKPARNNKRARSPAAGQRDGPWAFTRNHDDPGPPGGCGTWTLTLPGGQELTVQLGPIPLTDCDHRHESHGYQPSETLRHLVEIRDGECTFPSCSRHAGSCDFEHAVPCDKGGRTCACNGGARSRRCHKVKQSKGWTVTQPRPGWHQWATPSGRTYTQSPKRYPG